MKITKPKWATIVEPSEYPIEEQFDAAVRDANKNSAMYVPMDIGKVVGLLEDWQAVAARLDEVEKELSFFRQAFPRAASHYQKAVTLPTLTERK